MTRPKPETSSIGGLAKKVFLTGLGAAAVTEEGIRKLFNQNFAEILRREVHRFLSTLNLTGEIEKALSQMALEIQATVTFRSLKNPLVDLHEIKVKK